MLPYSVALSLEGKPALYRAPVTGVIGDGGDHIDLELLLTFDRDHLAFFLSRTLTLAVLPASTLKLRLPSTALRFFASATGWAVLKVSEPLQLPSGSPAALSTGRLITAQDGDRLETVSIKEKSARSLVAALMVAALVLAASSAPAQAGVRSKLNSACTKLNGSLKSIHEPDGTNPTAVLRYLDKLISAYGLAQARLQSVPLQGTAVSFRRRARKWLKVRDRALTTLVDAQTAYATFDDAVYSEKMGQWASLIKAQNRSARRLGLKRCVHKV